MATSHGSDLLEIEVDGELPTTRGSDGPRRSGRRPPAVAWAVVGTVAAVIVVAVASAAFDAGRAPPRSEVRSTTPSEGDVVLSAASAAMSAWGEFAGTGEISFLDGHFDPSGPQYRQLASEATGITETGAVGGYGVETAGVVKTLSGDTATVHATVVWRRDAEPEQRWEWIIDLRRRGASWTVWTVRTT